MNKNPNYPHPLPVIPPGMDYAKDSFWFRLRHKFTWKNEKTAKDWYLSERATYARYGKQFPPAPVFTRRTVSPQPWDGRGEKPGRIPWTGKE